MLDVELFTHECKVLPTAKSEAQPVKELVISLTKLVIILY